VNATVQALRCVPVAEQKPESGPGWQLGRLGTVYQVRSTAPERSGRAISVFGEVIGERREEGAPFGRMKML
jgi:hypothetical protein